MINETDYSKNTLSKEQEKQIDAIFSQYDSNSSPGCSVGIIKNGQFAYKKSFGMANLDYEIPITANSKFEIASVSKQFTAVCIGLLAIDNKLDLDDDIRKYIPEIPDYGKIITIRHLLFHTNGLRDYMCIMGYSGFDLSKDYCNNKDGLRVLCMQKNLNYMPGEKFAYNNSGYLVLTEIIEIITGMTFGEYAEANIFKPLGMDNTYVEENSRKVVKDRVVGYEKDDNNEYIRCYGSTDDTGAKGIITTINDLFLWNQNFDYPKVGGEKLITMLKSKGTLDNNEEIDYSFGLKIYDYKNLKFIGHAGGYGGFRSRMMLFLDHETSILILCNQTDEIYALSNSVADIVMAADINKLDQSSKEIKIEDIIVNLTEAELEGFCGHYWSDESKLARKVYIKDGCLSYWRDEGNESQLMPISTNELVMLDQQAHVRLSYEFNNGFTRINFFENDRCTTKLTSYEPIEFTTEYLSKYIGNYSCEDLVGDYKLKIESGKLTYCIRDSKISLLKPVIKDQFKFEDEDCFIEFIYNDKKDITGFKLDALRVKNLFFVKQ